MHHLWRPTVCGRKYTHREPGKLDRSHAQEIRELKTIGGVLVGGGSAGTQSSIVPRQLLTSKRWYQYVCQCDTNQVVSNSIDYWHCASGWAPLLNQRPDRRLEYQVVYDTPTKTKTNRLQLRSCTMPELEPAPRQTFLLWLCWLAPRSEDHSHPMGDNRTAEQVSILNQRTYKLVRMAKLAATGRDTHKIRVPPVCT